MEMPLNHSFVLETSDGKRSRLGKLRNSVPQGSVLSQMLFNIYVHNLLETRSRKYSDNLAIMLQRPTSKAVKDALNQGMDVLVAYLQRWWLQLKIGKTVTATYHLHNREAKRGLGVFVSGRPRACQQASNLGEVVKREDLPCQQRTLLNRLHTGVGCYKSLMQKWGLKESMACKCGEPVQSAEHIITTSPLYRPPSEVGLFYVGPETRAWFHNTEFRHLTMVHEEEDAKPKINILNSTENMERKKNIIRGDVGTVQC